MPTPPRNESTAAKIAETIRNRRRYLAALRRLEANPDFQRVVTSLRASAGLPVAGIPGSPCFIANKSGRYDPYHAAFRDGRKSILAELEAHALEARGQEDDPDTGQALDPSEKDDD